MNAELSKLFVQLRQTTLLFICTLFSLSLYASNGIKGPVRTLFFTENKNQWDKKYLYQSLISNGLICFEKDAFQYYFFNPEDFAEAVKHPAPFYETLKPKQIRAHAVRVSFTGSNPNAHNESQEPLPFYYNYFLGSDSTRWASEVHSYHSFIIKELYEGINLKVRSINEGPIKYDLIIAPHKDPGVISMYYEGAEAIKINQQNLYIKTTVNTLVEGSPVAYQKINGDSIPVECYYRADNNLHVWFELGKYNRDYELVIDPLLIFSTYSGSTADNFGSSATYDSEGNLFTAGITESVSSGRYPATQGAFMMNASGGSAGTWPQPGFACDITFSKYNNDGTQLLYATYLGGTQNDYPHSLVVDRNDQLIVMGSTLSNNFPTTIGAFDRTFNDSFDIILSKFSKNGNLLIGSTYIGGSHSDGISVADTLCAGYMDHMRGEVIVDDNNDILVGSVTSSINFPVTSSAVQKNLIGRQDGCVFKIDSVLKIMKWCTYLGDTFDETLNSIDVDVNGNVFVTGGTSSKHSWMSSGPSYDNTYNSGVSDAYLAKLNSSATSLLKFVYWGSISYDQGYFVKTHKNGDVYMLGQNFDTIPVTPGVYFNSKGTINIACFSNSLDTLRFSTRIGNAANKNLLMPSAFMVDLCGNVYASIWGGPINISSFYRTGGFLMGASSTTFGLQTTAGALQTVTDNRDFYLFELSSNLTNLLYATYMGEIGGDDHVDGGTSRFDHRGIIYQSFCASCGSGTGGTFPTTSNSYAPRNLSSRCSNASMKLDFRKSNVVVADFTVNKPKTCVDSIVTFTNNSYNGVRFVWYVNNVYRDTTYHFADTFRVAGTYQIKLVVTDSSRCNIIDSLIKIVDVGVSSKAKFTYIRDTCTALVFFQNKSVISNNSVVPYLWNFGDGDTSSATNPTHLFKKNGTYRVRLFANAGSQCQDSTSLLINYDSTSQVLKASLIPFDTLDCAPAQIHITNSSKNGKQFYWYVNDTLSATTKNFDSTFAIGLYCIKFYVVDSATCSKIDSAKVRVRVLPDVTPDFVPVRDTCSLTVRFDNLSNLLPGDSINFTWFFGDGDTTNTRNPVHTFPNPGKYFVQLFANPRMNCVKQKDMWLFLDNNKNVLEARFTPIPPTACRPAQIIFDNTSINGSKFYWYLNNQLTDSTINLIKRFDTSGNYQLKLIAIDSGSCKKSDTTTMDFTVYPFADAQFTVKRDSCSKNILFTNKTDTINPDTIHYLWNFDDGDTSVLRQPAHIFTQTKTYNIKLVTNPYTPCADSIIIPINYDSSSHLLKASFTLNDTFFCIPAKAHVINTSQGAPQGKWYLDNTYLKDTNELDIDLPIEGKYKIKLVVNNPSSCFLNDSVTKEITVKPSVKASFIIQRDSCSLDVKFINTSDSGNFNQTYLWDFGDGDTSTLKYPTHQYKESNTYTITLTANPGSQCTSSSSQQWRINGDTDQVLFIPNVFTPNGDKLNDCYFIRGVSAGCDEFHIWIRNRWGDLYFESTDPDKCWNGKNDLGTEASEGVYFYIIKLRKKGQSFEKSGTVTLIRN